MTKQQPGTGTGKNGRAINLSALTKPGAPDRTQGLPPPPPRPVAAPAAPSPVVPAAAAPPAVQERPAAPVTQPAPVPPAPVAAAAPAAPQAQPPAAAEASPAEASPADAKPAPKPAATAKPRRRRARRNSPAPDCDDIAVYLPVSTRDQLRRYHGANPGTTYTDVMYDAFDDADDATLKALVIGDSAQRTSGRFAGRKLRRLRHDEPQVQVTFRPSQEDADVIDGLAEQYGAPNRSILVARAIARYLDKKGYGPDSEDED